MYILCIGLLCYMYSKTNSIKTKILTSYVKTLMVKNAKLQIENKKQKEDPIKTVSSMDSVSSWIDACNQ